MSGEGRYHGYPELARWGIGGLNAGHGCRLSQAILPGGRSDFGGGDDQRATAGEGASLTHAMPEHGQVARPRPLVTGVRQAQAKIRDLRQRIIVARSGRAEGHAHVDGRRVFPQAHGTDGRHWGVRACEAERPTINIGHARCGAQAAEPGGRGDGSGEDPEAVHLEQVARPSAPRSDRPRRSRAGRSASRGR